jgi:3D (Asp-Asp-Asp) domain-containing protein
MLFGRNKDRAIQVKMVKTPKDGDSSTNSHITVDPETVKLIAERSKEVLKVGAAVVIGIYAAIKAIDTASQIAVKKTRSADND